MSMERARRDRFTSIAPSAGEFKAACMVAALFFFLVTPLVVQAVIGFATSGHFALPNAHLLDAYEGLLHGQFGVGLRPSVAETLPPHALMWVLTAVGEVLVLGAAAVVGIWMRGLTGATSLHGLATPAQAAEALGVPRLRKSAEVVRPDLYARSSQRRSPVRSKRRAANQPKERTL
jgi:hypothetical protein